LDNGLFALLLYQESHTLNKMWDFVVLALDECQNFFGSQVINLHIFGEFLVIIECFLSFQLAKLGFKSLDFILLLLNLCFDSTDFSRQICYF